MLRSLILCSDLLQGLPEPTAQRALLPQPEPSSLEQVPNVSAAACLLYEGLKFGANGGYLPETVAGQ